MILGANTSITTYRLIDSSNTTAYNATPVIVGAEAYIESPSPELAAVLGEQLNVEVFNCYVDPADYRIGDKIVDSSGVEYGIAAIERHENNEDTDDSFNLRIHRTTVLYNE